MSEHTLNNELYAAITRDVLAGFSGACEAWDEFQAGQINDLPHHLICSTPTMDEAVTDLTVHLWQDMARVVIYHEWNADTALVGLIHYGLDFGDGLRELIQNVEQRLRVIPDPREAIESLVME